MKCQQYALALVFTGLYGYVLGKYVVQITGFPKFPR